MSTTQHTPARRALTAAFAAYLAIIVLGTAYPYRFEVPRYLRQGIAPAPAWDGSDGMVFDGIGLFWEGGPRGEIAAAVAETGAFYIYVEAMPTRAKQYGPSRILAYSRSTEYQAVMVGQWGEDLVLRIRSAPTERGKATGEWRIAGALETHAWNAILVVADGSAVCIYHNGAPVATLPGVHILSDTWRRDCYLIAGNEATGNRGWYGRLRRVEFGAGAPPPRLLAEARVSLEPPTAGTAPDAAPLFTCGTAGAGRPEGWTSRKTDVAGRGLRHPWTLMPFRDTTQIHNPWIDWGLNVALFVPFGWLLRQRGASVLFVVALACATSLSIETLQIFLPTRTCDTTDVILNTAGGLVGVLLARRRTRRTGA